MAKMSNKEKTMQKITEKMPMGMAEISIEKRKPISVEFTVKAEKKKIDGSDGITYSCQRFGSSMDEPKNEHSSVDGLLKYLKGQLASAQKELGGKKSEEKSEEGESY